MISGRSLRLAFWRDVTISPRGSEPLPPLNSARSSVSPRGIASADERLGLSGYPRKP